MEHPNLPSNSDKSKMKATPTAPEKKQLAPVVTNPVVQKRPSLGTRFKNVFVSGDGRSVGRYILGGVLIPAMKNMVVDAVKGGIDRAVYGESDPRRQMRPSAGIYGQTQYNRPVYRPDPRQVSMLPDQPPYVSPRSNGELNFVLQTREEADVVVDTLAEAVSMYGLVTVADLYQLLGMPFSHQDNKWGWTIPQMATIRQVREGYHLTMPPAEPID